MANTSTGMLKEVALRIKSLRLDCGYTLEEMSAQTGFSLADCEMYENGNADLSGAYVDSTNVALRPAMYLSIK